MRTVVVWTFLWLVFYTLVHFLEVSGYWRTSLTSTFAFGMSLGMFIGWAWMDYWWQKSNDLLIEKIKELEHYDLYS